MREWRYSDISDVFSKYHSESQACVVRLESYLSSANASLDLKKTTIPAANLVKIDSRSANNISETEVCAILKSCVAVEESCKNAYQDVIYEIDDSLGAFVYELRRQADSQYVAYNHIKTLLDCNSLNLQAV